MAKTKSIEDLIADAVSSLAQAQKQIKSDVNRHEKILAVQALQIETLERNVMELRNAAIAAELRLGTSNKDVAAKYGLSPGRVSQIKNTQ
jgi:DNA-binding NarL/FixJ family response regulator